MLILFFQQGVCGGCGQLYYGINPARLKCRIFRTMMEYIKNIKLKNARVKHLYLDVLHSLLFPYIYV